MNKDPMLSLKPPLNSSEVRRIPYLKDDESNKSLKQSEFIQNLERAKSE